MQQDTYSNVSRILTCPTISAPNNQVEVDQEAVSNSLESSTDSSLEDKELEAAVEAQDEALLQGETNSEVACLVYGVDSPPVDLYTQVMTPYPPPFLTVQEMEQGYANDDYFTEHEEEENSLTPQGDYGYSVQEEYDAYQEDLSNTVQVDSITERNDYNAEFAAYYANYEEGAPHLYEKVYEETAGDVYDEDAEDVYEEDGD